MAKKMSSFLFFFLSIVLVFTPIKSENSYVTRAAIGVVAALVGTTLAGLAYKYFMGKKDDVSMIITPKKSVTPLSTAAVKPPHYSGFEFFWQVPDDVVNGRVETKYTSSCFSQWYPSEFTAFAIDFKTAEHFMMYFKALHFAYGLNKDTNDAIATAIIASTRTGKEAKDWGKKVNLVPADWDKFSELYVYAGNMEKFSQNEGLKNYLLGTGNKFLAEASPYDKVWGIGLKINDTNAKIRTDWQGINKLGYILMMVRSELQKSDPFRPATLYNDNIDNFIIDVKNPQSKMMIYWKTLSDQYKNNFGVSSDWKLLPGKK